MYAQNVPNVHRLSKGVENIQLNIPYYFFLKRRRTPYLYCMYKQSKYIAINMSDSETAYSKCLYYSANALARSLTRIAEEEFSVTGIAPSYAFLIMAVNSEPGIQPSKISRQLQLSPSTITRLIEKMERRGLVIRKLDGKFTKVFPTEKAQSLDLKIRKAWNNLFKKYSTVLGENEGRDLTDKIYNASQKLD